MCTFLALLKRIAISFELAPFGIILEYGFLEVLQGEAPCYKTA